MMNDALARSPDAPFVVVPIVTDNAEGMIDRVIREKENPHLGWTRWCATGEEISPGIIIMVQCYRG